MPDKEGRHKERTGRQTWSIVRTSFCFRLILGICRTDWCVPFNVDFLLGLHFTLIPLCIRQRFRPLLGRAEQGRPLSVITPQCPPMSSFVNSAVLPPTAANNCGRVFSRKQKLPSLLNFDQELVSCGFCTATVMPTLLVPKRTHLFRLDFWLQELESSTGHPMKSLARMSSERREPFPPLFQA
jgi:hypothetical protein